MITLAFAQNGLRRFTVQTAQNQHMLAMRFKRLEDRRKLKVLAALARRLPRRRDHTVRDIKRARTNNRTTCRGQSRDHAVQERQRNGCASSPQKRAATKM